MKKCVYCEKIIWFKNVHKMCELAFNLIFARKRFKGEVEHITSDDIRETIKNPWEAHQGHKT